MRLIRDRTRRGRRRTLGSPYSAPSTALILFPFWRRAASTARQTPYGWAEAVKATTGPKQRDRARLKAGDRSRPIYWSRDGIHSAVRAQNARPDRRHSRAMSPGAPSCSRKARRDAPDPVACAWMETRQACVTYVLRGGELCQSGRRRGTRRLDQGSWTDASCSREMALSGFRRFGIPQSHRLIEESDAHLPLALSPRPAGRGPTAALRSWARFPRSGV
jgi:hypothetical protein